MIDKTERTYMMFSSFLSLFCMLLLSQDFINKDSGCHDTPQSLLSGGHNIVI